MIRWTQTIRRHWPELALMATLTIGLPGMALAGGAVANGLGLEQEQASGWTTDDPTAQLHGRCFPAAKWGDTPADTADDFQRPCVRITRVYEDGSFKAAVQDADGPTRYSIGFGVPDGYECREHLIAPKLCR